MYQNIFLQTQDFIPPVSWYAILLTAILGTVGFLFQKWINNVSEQDKASTKALTDIFTNKMNNIEDKILELKRVIDSNKTNQEKIEERFNEFSYKVIEKIQELRIIIAKNEPKDE